MILCFESCQSCRWKRKWSVVLLTLCTTLLLCACKTDEQTKQWNPSLFEKPSTQYNNQLALIAAEMSEKAEDQTGEGIEGLLSGNYGIRNYETYNYGESAAFVIGHDTLRVNGIDTTILVIVARGTRTWDEGIGDLVKGFPFNKTRDFLGRTVWDNVYDFEEKIWGGLNDYLKNHPDIENTANLKILVTGHSLGGAAANMVAARFTQFAEWGGWWSDTVEKEDIYAYTFGAIKVLTTEDNVTEGYENIHNVYNYYDSYGPYGNLGYTNVSSINSKFGHTELYSVQHPEDGIYPLTDFKNHLMGTYKEALNEMAEDSSFIQLACEEKLCTEDILESMLEDISAEAEPDEMGTDDDTENITFSSDFAIEGKWKSVGDYGFGQAQPGAIVAFDGTHCNFYSPSDTYALYQEDSKWRLDCTDFLFANTVSFTVEIIDNDNIYVYYGSDATELKRVN